MSERERTNFLKAAVSRAPGKRQIKPSAAIFEVEAGTLDDDEDDEDFQASDNDSINCDSSSNNDDESSIESVSDNDGQEKIIVLTNEEAKQHGVDNINALCSEFTESLVCSICLNSRRNLRDVEVIQCDRCGLAVHEICYAVEEPPDDASITSVSSTEPWFCEPCMFGYNNVPYCELCPSRYGAFKKTNVDGCWVHLVCALYTPNISFGDTDFLTAISWQEMDYRSFGRKSCDACINKLEARTGVTVQCEAGLCKNFYHVTCAQKLGFLMDNDSDNHHHSLLSPSSQHEFNFLLCKRHNNSESIRNKKEAYIKFIKQENYRLSSFRRLLLNSRQELKRLKQLERYNNKMKHIENFTTINPRIIKRTRMLHNNSRFLNLFKEKMELSGLNDYESRYYSLLKEQIPIIPPSFSEEFIKYYNHREEFVFKEEEERLIAIKEEKLSLQTHLENLENDYKTALEKLEKIKENNKSSLELLNKFCDTLFLLNVPKKHYSNVLSSILSPETKLIPATSSESLNSDSKNLTSNQACTTNVEKKKIIERKSKKRFIDTEKKLVDTKKIHLNDSNQSPSSNIQNIEKNELCDLKIKKQRKNKSLFPENASTFINENFNTKINNSSSLTSSNHQLNNNPVILSQTSAQSSPTKDSIKRPNILSRNNKTSFVNVNLLKQDAVNASNNANNCINKIQNDKNCKKSLNNIDEKSIITPLICFVCSKTNDQNLIIFCDSCKHNYHISCLDPPLNEMPQKKKNFAFQCSNCAYPDSSGEDNKVVENIINDSTPLVTRRSRRFSTFFFHSYGSLSPQLPTTSKRKKLINKKDYLLNSSLDSTKNKTCKDKKVNTEFFLNGKTLNALTTNFQSNVSESTNIPFNLPITIDTQTNYNCGNNINKVYKRSRKQSLKLTPSPNISTSFYPLYSIDTNGRMQYHNSTESQSKISNLND